MKKYFVTGLLIWIPLVITLMVLAWIVNTLDQILLIAPAAVRPDALLGFHLPGVGVLVTLLLILLTGTVASMFAASQWAWQRSLHAESDSVQRQLALYGQTLAQRIDRYRTLPEVLAALEIENPVLVGHSDGASIALLHAGAGLVGNRRGLIGGAAGILHGVFHVADDRLQLVEEAVEPAA